jgi:cytochrome c oxidase subunit II
MRRRLASVVVLALVGTGCAAERSMVAPRGDGARHINDLWWLMFWLSVVAMVVVGAALVVALWAGARRRSRRDGDEDQRPQRISERGMILLGGVLFPVLILAPVAVMTVRTGQLVARTGGEALEVRVQGHQFWWEVTYPEQGAVTANEIHLPVGQPVRLVLTSNDVIHSFWVPELHGKMDLIPGRVNTLELTVEQPGTYTGQCAEYCGLQHALMFLRVTAHPPEEFQAWVAREAQPAANATTEQQILGREAFAASCGLCHTVRGVNQAYGVVGPDLTHLASRETLAAGALTNTPTNLARWLLDPQGVKPGNRMPAIGLDEEDLEELMAYLEILE